MLFSIIGKLFKVRIKILKFFKEKKKFYKISFFCWKFNVREKVLIMFRKRKKFQSFIYISFELKFWKKKKWFFKIRIFQEILINIKNRSQTKGINKEDNTTTTKKKHVADEAGNLWWISPLCIQMNGTVLAFSKSTTRKIKKMNF